MADDIPTITVTAPRPTPVPGNAAGTTPIIGNAAVTQPTTSGVGGLAPPTSTPASQTTPALPQLSLNGTNPPASPGTQGAQSYMASLAAGMQQNPLNLYWQTAYHFRLFMVNDEYVFNQVPITQLLSQVNTNAVRQVIIAESGVTGYNIRSVEIDTINANNHYTQAQKAQKITMVITEPMGLSFLDALWAGAGYLQIFDYTKANYFLLLSFTGYNSSDAGTGTDGTYAGNPIKFPAPFNNGGQWLYVLTLTDVALKIDEGSTVYTLLFNLIETAPLMLEAKQFSTMTDGLTVSGKTVGDMYTDFTTQLNAKWKERFIDKGNNSLMKFDIVTHPIPWAGNQDPKTFSMLNAKPHDSSVRSLAMSATTNGIPTAHIPPGMTINEFIVNAIKASEQGQKLIVDDPNPANPDVSASQATATGIRLATLFSVEPVIDLVSRDPVTGNYGKHVTLHVTPTVSMTAIVDPKQRDDALSDPNVQRTMISVLTQNGMLRKEYDYIFTGLNTEVIDFNLDFHFAWSAMLPKQGGVRRDSNSETVNQHYNPSVKSAPMPDDPPQDMVGSFIQSLVHSPNASGGKLYVEDLLSAYNQGQAPGGQQVLPVSFWTGAYNVAAHDPKGFTAQYTPSASIAASVFSQVLAAGKTNEGPEGTGYFQQINLTIRGDPYWLGQSNVERQSALQTPTKPINDPNNLPSLSSGNPSFILKFKYPLQIGDNFTPILKDSAVFNGVYEVIGVKHVFADGVFKQTLTANRFALINLYLAASSAPAINTSQNSPGTASGNQSGSQGGPSSGSTPGTGSGTIAPTGSLPNSAQLQALSQESYNFWISNGYSPAGAAAMVAQEEAESQFGTAPNTNVPGVQAGNFQWSPTREAQILQGTGIDVSTADHMGQLQAALWEQTQGGYTSVGSQLMTATDPGAAGVLATTKYEIPANTAVQAQIRGGRSAFWATQYAGTPLPNAS